MKSKKIIGFIAVLAIAALAAFNLSLNNQESRLSDIALANINDMEDEDFEGKGGTVSCTGGGPGSTSCSISQNYPGGLGASLSVSCGDGYYACCNKDSWGNLSAVCVRY